MLRPKSVDEFIETRERWQKEVAKLREILLSMKLGEAIKWNFPCYMHDGKNVVGLGGFKSYFGLWFFEGASLSDTDRVLVNAQDGKTKALRQWRMLSAKEIKVRKIKAYVNEAIEVSRLAIASVTRKPQNRSVEVPPELHAALKADRKAMEAFGKMTSAVQYECADYIAKAKRTETKIKRLAKMMPMIRRGVGPSDQYH